MGIKITQDGFLERAKSVHGDRYDYSEAVYVNARTKMKIIYEGVAYWQLSRSHLEGFRPEVNNHTFESFKIKCIDLYGDYYNLDKVVYINNNKKVIVNCPRHGDFEIVPRSLMSGIACSKCSKGTPSLIEFKQEGDRVHKSFYNYDKVVMEMYTDKVIVTCPDHGDFKVRANVHITQKTGCSKCSGNRKLTTTEVIDRSENLYPDYNFGYAKTIANGYSKSIIINCPVHGDFKVSLDLHLNSGKHCKTCMRNNVWTWEHFLTQAIEVHGDTYEYHSDGYINSVTKINIRCKKHGMFSQLPEAHIRNSAGCPVCKTSKGERKIMMILNEKTINYSHQHKFDGCRNKQVLPFDFYIEDMGLCIEFDGRHHFEPVSAFGGQEGFESQIIRDNIKNQYCVDNNIKLIRISYKDKIEEKLDFLISP